MQIISKLIKSKVVGRTVVASFDQALNSATSFGITLLLLKYVSKVEFGYFSIVLTIITYITWIQNAIINTPLTVLLASKSSEEEIQFSSSLFRGQNIIVILFSIISVSISLFIYFFYDNDIIPLIIAAASFALIGILSRTYFRQLSYAQEQPKKALKQDALFTLFYAVFILISLLISYFNIVIVLVGMGVCNILVFTLYNVHESPKRSVKEIKAAYSESWKLGRWSLVGITVTHFQTYSYQYLIAIMLGSISVAENSASRLLISPLIFMQAGWGSIVRPRGAKLREQNQMHKFFKELIIASILIAVAISAYLILIYSASSFFKRYLFTDKYEESMDYVFYWGGVFVSQYITVNASYGLQVIKKFKDLALINVFTMIITVVLTYFFILDYQIKGALVASIIGESIFGVILWYFLYSYIKGKDPLNKMVFAKLSFRNPHIKD